VGYAWMAEPPSVDQYAHAFGYPDEAAAREAAQQLEARRESTEPDGRRSWCAIWPDKGFSIDEVVLSRLFGGSARYRGFPSSTFTLEREREDYKTFEELELLAKKHKHHRCFRQERGATNRDGSCRQGEEARHAAREAANAVLRQQLLEGMRAKEQARLDREASLRARAAAQHKKVADRKAATEVRQQQQQAEREEKREGKRKEKAVCQKLVESCKQVTAQAKEQERRQLLQTRFEAQCHKAIERGRPAHIPHPFDSPGFDFVYAGVDAKELRRRRLEKQNHRKHGF
jgi:hypothetical protein